MEQTILIVEDHDAVRTSLRWWLEATFPHCRILEATTGEMAVALARLERPPVIIMDLSLPRMSGIEATRRIKVSVPEARIVMLTIHEDTAYRIDAAAAGAHAYVPKRSLQTQLLPTLKTLLSDQNRPEDAQHGP